MVKKVLNHGVIEEPVEMSVRRKTPIKMSSGPQIVICFPIGPKYRTTNFRCPEELDGCGHQWASQPVLMPNLIPVQLMLNHMNLQQPLNCAMSYLVECGRLSAEARQIMTMEAIKQGAKYILYWDDDTLPPPDGLYVMHNYLEKHPEVGAISGVYTTRVDPNEPLIYKEHGAGCAWDFEMGPGAEPEPILGAGAGFLLARVEAVVECNKILQEENGGVPVPIWADEQLVPESRAERRGFWGHDMRFCRILNENGWPVYVDGRVLCGHIDASSGVTYTVPDDAPGFALKRKRNINTKAYWDSIYEGEGGWARWMAMADAIAAEVAEADDIVELGCGNGLLGLKLAVQGGHCYTGYDISEVAVEMCKAKFLNASVLDVKDLAHDHFSGADCLLAVELMEHLEESTFLTVIQKWLTSETNKFVFTVPDNCMGPDEVPEHTALFNEELVRERIGREFQGEAPSMRFSKPDDKHLMVVLEK